MFCQCFWDRNYYVMCVLVTLHKVSVRRVGDKSSNTVCQVCQEKDFRLWTRQEAF